MGGGQYGERFRDSLFTILILIIGSGSIGRRHIHNLQGLIEQPEFVLLRDDAREDEFSRGLGARVVGSFEAAVALRPALAVIATPSIRHLEALQFLLPAQVPCYVEKPVIASEEQAEFLEAMLASLPLVPPTHVGCNLRYLPSLKRLRRLIHEGAIGRPVRVSLQAGQWLPDWRPAQDYRASYSADPIRGGGVVLDLVHELDAARWLFGEFDEVHAVGGHYSRLEIGVEDSVTVLLGRARGPAVAVGLDYVARRPMRRYEIIGDEGSLLWDLPARRLELIRAQESESIDCGQGGFDIAETYVTAMSELLAATKFMHPTSQDISDGLRSARLALNVNKKLRI